MTTRRRQRSPDTSIPARRVWRLSYLLTGSRETARSVLLRLPEFAPCVDPDDPARLDRAVILELRTTHPPIPDTTIDELHRAALDLPRQSAEAWFLHRIDELDDLRACRAMDCSRTAAARHLDLADRTLTARFSDELDSRINAFRSAIDASRPDSDIEISIENRARSDHRRRILIGITILAGILILPVLALVLLR